MHTVYYILYYIYILYYTLYIYTQYYIYIYNICSKKQQDLKDLEFD